MNVQIFEIDKAKVMIPLMLEAIHAGFESPAADYEEARIDLNSYVSNYPEATFYARVVGDCMINSGIQDGDILVVNRSLKPGNGDVVVGILDGEFILRTYYKKGNREYLMPDNPKYTAIERNESTQFEIWGVVHFTVLNQKGRRDVRIDRLQQLLR